MIIVLVVLMSQMVFLEHPTYRLGSEKILKVCIANCVEDLSGYHGNVHIFLVSPFGAYKEEFRRGIQNEEHLMNLCGWYM